ncbi:MAG: biopolymer transporter ExbD [Gammaproteobacteria bacterium]|nr:biopolymer transporter ExbD [Gammaproteobacteria bacterium]
MQFEGRRRTSYVPNLTPLIDIVFLLLVFFMLTSHFVRDEVINIDLPEAESGESLDEPEQIEIVINEAGKFLFNSRIVTPDSLEDILRNELKDQKEKVVRIRGDEHVELGIAIAVLDAARKAGASGVDIVTIDTPARTPSDKPGPEQTQ